MAGCVGDDVLGRAMLEALAGVDVSAVRVVEEPTGISVGLARPGDRAVLTAQGALAVFSADDVPDELLASARWIHVAAPFLQPALDVAAIAERAAGTTSLDPGWDPSERWELAWEGFDVLLPNEQEAEQLGASGPGVVVKLGADGARCGDLRVAAPRVDPVDATGAGDSFDAGFITARLAGEDLAAALALGCACGALSTRAAGGTAGQPTLAEARSFHA
jgi:sugar/nucleoside kinase (ribokinase family)